MVSLAPPLKACLEIQLHIENGKSVSQSTQNYVQNHLSDPFAKELGLWLFEEKRGKSPPENKKLYRRMLIEILKRGLNGEPILESLQELEKELIEACKNDLDQKLIKLPYMSLIPLLLFQFPALFLILVGPLFLQLLEIL